MRAFESRSHRDDRPPGCYCAGVSLPIRVNEAFATLSRLLQGKVDMENPIPYWNSKSNGKVLTCRHPLTDDVKILVE